MEKVLWPIIGVALRRLVPVALGAVILALVTAGLLDGQAADACRAALGL